MILYRIKIKIFEKTYTFIFNVSCKTKKYLRHHSIYHKKLEKLW